MLLMVIWDWEVTMNVANRGINVALLLLGRRLKSLLTGNNEDLRVDGVGEGEVDGKLADEDAHNSCDPEWGHNGLFDSSEDGRMVNIPRQH
jgi:hypothetical protein